MQALQRFAITAVFTLTCFTVPVQAQAAERLGREESEKVQPATKGVLGSSGSKDVLKSGRDLEQKVRQLEQRYSSERDVLLSKVKELVKRQRDGSKEEQEKVRQQVRKLSDQYLEIKELRKEQIEELKREHPEHRQLIEAAREATKEEFKEKVRERRGHGDK